MKLYLKCISTFIFLIISLAPVSVYAIQFEDAVFPEQAVSARALAMGNAFICKVDDSTASFYNPAGLGTVRYPHLHISNLHLEANKDWMNMGAGGKATDVGSNFMKGFSLEGTRQLFADTPGNRGKISHRRVHVLPNFTARYISLGFLYSKATRATRAADEDAQFEYADRLDYGPYGALNLSLFGGIVKFGGSAIILRRKEAIGEADPDASITLEEGDYNKGVGLITTGGVRVTLPWTFLPTFAATIHNATAQKFSGGDGAPTQIKQTVDVGFSLTPQIGTITRVHLEANYKDIGSAYSGVSSTRRIVMGLELDIARIMFFRAGYGDGYGSFGVGLRTRKLEFDLTSYAVDSTSSGFRGKEDRRFAMSLSSGF